ncbi:hypothetical protein AGOR_G00209620 [Albula goreensis]|uniref:Uncharacterized protein n=1 Tax=Albula goreensis TaxID=1534307 RepID=A0A8T3CU19_9TELE|nr:hypothetical protein AGOR_G00209620 [Albula goreensis]
MCIAQPFTAALMPLQHTLSTSDLLLGRSFTAHILPFMTNHPPFHRNTSHLPLIDRQSAILMQSTDFIHLFGLADDLAGVASCNVQARGSVCTFYLPYLGRVLSIRL